MSKIFDGLTAGKLMPFGAMDARARIAWNLRRLRVERGVSQEGLAFEAAVDRTYISGIERRTFNPTIDILERLAAALTIDVIELLGVPQNEEPPLALKSGRKPQKRLRP